MLVNAGFRDQGQKKTRTVQLPILCLKSRPLQTTGTSYEMSDLGPRFVQRGRRAAAREPPLHPITARKAKVNVKIMFKHIISNLSDRCGRGDGGSYPGVDLLHEEDTAF